MSRGAPVTPAERARFGELRAAGATFREIAEATGRHISTIGDHFRPGAAEKAAKRAAFLKARLDRVRAMIAEGRGRVAIVSAELGCGHSTASDLLARAGSPPRPHRQLTQREVRVVKDLRAKGLGCKRIGAAVGRRPRVVSRIVKRIEAGLLAAALCACCGGAEARQTPGMACGKLADLRTALATEYGEKPVSFGLRSDGQLLEIFASPDGGTWTALTAGPGGFACVVAAGKSWQQGAAIAAGKPA